MKFNVLEIFLLKQWYVSLLIVEMNRNESPSIIGEWIILKDSIYYKKIHIIQENIPLKPINTDPKNTRVLEVNELLNKEDLDISKYKIEITQFG